MDIQQFIQNVQFEVNALKNQLQQMNGRGNDSIYRQWYIYSFEVFQLAGNNTSDTDSFTVDADADFIWVKSAYYADINGAAFTDSARPIPNVTVQITDTGSGRNFFNTPVPIASAFGTGELPMINPVSQRLIRNSTLNAQFLNFDAATQYNLRLALIGYKDFRAGDTSGMPRG